MGFNWGGLLGGVTGGISNIISTAMANKSNKELANTAHQREMEDLEAAGINPLMTAASGGQGAASPTMQAANVGDIISNIPSQMADIENTDVDTEFNEASMDYRLEGLNLGNEAQEQEIKNMVAEEKQIYENITWSEADRMLKNAQTEREKVEALRIMKAGELITEQIKTEILKQGLSRQEYQLLFENTEVAHQLAAKLAQELRLVTQQTRLAEINSRWLEEEKIQQLTNEQMHAIASMISAVGNIVKPGMSMGSNESTSTSNVHLFRNR
jgi:hypothetical protein